MRALPQRSAVLVLSAPSDEVTRIGVAARRVLGVTAVVAYPERGQVIIRYDPERVAVEQIRSATRREADGSTDAHFWLSAWPRLASALPTAAGLL